MEADIKSVVITGSSSGMGRACAIRLSRSGFRVFATVRKSEDGARLAADAGSGLVPIILDVSESDTIDAAAERVGEAVGEKGLQGLVNNAGIGMTGPLEYLPIERLRRAFEINLVGQLAVIQALLPLVRAGGGRIVNVGSVGGRVAVPFGSPISSTKAAFESLTDSLRLELARWHIPVVLVAPGSIHTPAVERLAGESDSVVAALSSEARERYERVYRGFIGHFIEMETKGVGPEVMAETVYRALTVRRPRRRYAVGPVSRLLPFLARVLPGAALDALRIRLFGLADA